MVSGWKSRLDKVIRIEEDENLVLHEISTGRPLEPGAHVTVIVHPGDASGEPGIDGALASLCASLEARRAAGDRMVVLHRFSSTYMDPAGRWSQRESPPCREWFSLVTAICRQPDSLQFYGDHLDDFCARIVPGLAGAEAILVTGLWGDEADGCAATVARSLEEAGLPARLDPDVPLAWDREDFEPG